MFPHIPLRRNIEAALRDCQHPKLKVRLGAVVDLPRHVEAHRQEVIEALQRALADDETTVRTAAAESLADCQARRAVPALLAAAEDDYPEVRQMALAALGELGDRRALSKVREALDDPAPALRFQAVMAFVRICQDREQAIDVLLAATEDDDPRVCHIALRMAEELGPDPPDPDEDPDEQKRSAAEAPSAVVAPALLTRAASLAEHPNPIVRIAAAIIVARSGLEPDTGALIDVANGRLITDQADDEAAAIELCGQLGLREAIPGLLRRAKGSFLGLRQDRFAWQARVALAAMDYSWAVEGILRELRSSRRERRTLAVVAATRAKLLAAAPLIEAMQDKPGQANPQAVREALAVLTPSSGAER